MIKVYGVHGSPFVRKVFIALDYKGVPYEIVPQMPFSSDEEYKKINRYLLEIQQHHDVYF